MMITTRLEWILVFVYILFQVLNVADIVTTMIGLQYEGVIEGTGIVVYMVKIVGWDVFMVMKFAVVFLITSFGVYYYLHFGSGRDDHPVMSKIMAVLLIAILLIGVIYYSRTVIQNIKVIRRVS